MFVLARWWWVILLGICWSGCMPPQGPQDEEKESNYMAGKAYVQERNYDAAIETFEKALEVNPNSAMAHFELGVLYDQQRADYALALYHYVRAHRLRPNAHPGEIARERIEVCKRELAKTVTQTPTMEFLQQQVDRLNAENMRLRELVTQWTAYYQGRASAMPAGGWPAAVASNAPVPAAQAARNQPERPAAAPASAARPQRTHKVAPGDTPTRIAARYGIKVTALRAANPGLDDRRMRPGQTLVIPSP